MPRQRRGSAWIKGTSLRAGSRNALERAVRRTSALFLGMDSPLLQQERLSGLPALGGDEAGEETPAPSSLAAHVV